MITNKNFLDTLRRGYEEKELVKNALSILEPDEKQIVILRYFEDLHFEEISKVVGKKEGSLRVEVHRLLSKMKV